MAPIEYDLEERYGALQQRLGVTFRDPALLKRALTHRSFGPDHNERYEFLGDAVLGLVISDEICRLFPTATEGQLSRLRARIVQRETLAAVARELGLGEHLYLGEGERRTGGADRDSILANALEAVIAGLYLDTDLVTVGPVVIDWFEGRLASLTQEIDKDPKTELQEYLQARRCSLPRYEIVQVEGKSHDQTFYVECSVSLLDDPVTGIGPTRREAEQRAAGQVLASLIEPR